MAIFNSNVTNYQRVPTPHFLNPPALRSAPKEPKEAPKAKAPAPATVPSTAATAPAAAPEKTKEDEAPGGCGSRCFLTF